MPISVVFYDLGMSCLLRTLNKPWIQITKTGYSKNQVARPYSVHKSTCCGPRQTPTLLTAVAASGHGQCNNISGLNILPLLQPFYSFLNFGTTHVSWTRRNIHPLTPIVVINHPLYASSIFYDPWHPRTIYVPDSLFPQSLSKFSLVYLLAWHSPVHTPYISSPNHCLLFAAHAHTIATCFAVVPKLYHLILVSQPFTWNSIFSLSCSLMPPIHLTILITAH